MGVLEWLLELEGKGGENECGEGVSSEGIGGSDPPTTGAEVSVSSRFRDGGVSWAVRAEPQHHLCAVQLPSALLGRGSIDPSAQAAGAHLAAR